MLHVCDSGPAVAINNTISSFEKQELSVSERPELTAAKVVISGGVWLCVCGTIKQCQRVVY